MSELYELIQQNPDYFAWAFGLVNTLWLLFTYFNKQSHDRSLKQLEQNLRFDADRRLKIFDLKATQYSAYVTNLDAFGRKNQVDMPARMQPIFDKYLSDYLAATNTADKQKEHEAITWFSSQISTLIQEGSADALKLKAESNCLKLIATDEMLETFNELEMLTQQSMDTANEFIGKFIEIFMNKQGDAQEYQARLTEIAARLQSTAQKLLMQMRSEISGI